MGFTDEFDPATMSIRGRIGGLAKAARYDGRLATQPARDKFLARFLPDDPGLSAEDRERRARAALRAHMLRLALRSAKARRKQTSRRSGG